MSASSTLHVSGPASVSRTEKAIVKMLEARSADREAQEFVRSVKEIEKAMEEE